MRIGAEKCEAGVKKLNSGCSVGAGYRFFLHDREQGPGIGREGALEFGFHDRFDLKSGAEDAADLGGREAVRSIDDVGFAEAEAFEKQRAVVGQELSRMAHIGGAILWGEDMKAAAIEDEVEGAAQAGVDNVIVNKCNGGVEGLGEANGGFGEVGGGNAEAPLRERHRLSAGTGANVQKRAA